MRKVAFHTLGCKVNQYETEAMKELFEKADYESCDFSEFAHVYVINTCTVTSLGDRKSRQIISRAKKLNPHSIIVVTGCYAQTSPQEVFAIEGVNIVIGTANRSKIVELVEKTLEQDININAVNDIMTEDNYEDIFVSSSSGHTRAYIKVQDGCNQFCSYCIVPYARGAVRSRRPEDVYEEAVRLSNNGFAEIVFAGIHIASYGTDIGDINLSGLLSKVHNIEGIRRIRLSSIEPTLINEDFIKNLMSMDKICPHFHISLQSGCDNTLREMNRKYLSKNYMDAVDLIRSAMPDAAITTDVMVGFPGESDENFEESYEFIKKVGFSQIHTFKYSRRKGTPAANYKMQVEEPLKESRSKKIIDLGNISADKFMDKFIGEKLPVLYEYMTKPGLCTGYTPNYIRVEVQNSSSLQGKIIATTLKRVSGGIVHGEL